MSKIAVLCNDGVEEIECLTVVDFCRRAGIEVITVSVTGKRQIMGAHQIVFHADEVYADMNFDEFDGIVYPGGPGTGAMGEKPGVKELAQKFLNNGKMLAAICAAPGIGKKTAEKVILELKDKLSLEDALEHTMNGDAGDISYGDPSGVQSEAVQALTALGYSSTEALRAVKKIEITEAMDVEAVLKQALKQML